MGGYSFWRGGVCPVCRPGSSGAVLVQCGVRFGGEGERDGLAGVGGGGGADSGQDDQGVVDLGGRPRAMSPLMPEFGRGTFVRSRPPRRRVSAAQRPAEHRASGKPIFDTEAIAQGQVPSRQMLETGRVAAPADAAKWLEIKPGESVVIRKRLQLLDGEPAVISTSYYPLWVAADTRLESPDALPEGPDVLIESLGYRFYRGMEVFRVRMPTPDETRLLRLAPGVPIVQMCDVDYDPSGRPLQAAEDLYAGDRHEFAYEWTEEDIPS